MLFNSAVFAAFLPVVLILYWLLKRPGSQNALVVAASLVFYGWWDYRFLSLLLISTATDYFCALAIARSKERGGGGGGWLLLSVCINLGLLGVFKYYDFFVSSAVPIWNALGWSPDLLHVVLPVGISFYTFQTMAYTVDVYRGKFEARRSLLDVATYVMYFPQLVAGPIERPGHLLTQLEKPRTLSLDDVRSGIMLMVTGYFMKIVIADGVGPVANWAYGRLGLGEDVGPAHVLLGGYAFAFQVYGDFAGYSRIARGISKLLGVDLMVNFRQPYFSRTCTEVWTRWHISLSVWLRDYLYISLGGNRKGGIRTYVNLMLTMLLGGLWHGAAWTYVIWGALNGLYLVVERSLNVGHPKDWGITRSVLGVFLTFHLWVLGLLFFRAPSFAAAMKSLGSFVGPWSLPDLWPSLSVGLAALLVLAMDLPHLLHPGDELPSAHRKKWTLFTLAIAGAGFYMFPQSSAVPFIYFQF